MESADGPAPMPTDRRGGGYTQRTQPCSHERCAPVQRDSSVERRSERKRWMEDAMCADRDTEGDGALEPLRVLGSETLG